MSMDMRMFGSWMHGRIVLMAVMRIVFVLMGVLQGFMPVLMGVVLRQMQPYAPGHQAAGKQQSTTDLFTQ